MSAHPLLVAVPAYNCAKQIAKVIDQYALSNFDSFIELLVIDNCSKDATLEMALESAQKYPNKSITIIQNDQNYGLGGTHKVAFQYAINKNYNGVVILHGDDQGRLSDIERYLNNQNLNKYDCILGARFMEKSILKGYSKTRVLGNYVFNHLYTACTSKRIFDMGSGLNYFSSKLIATQLHRSLPDDLTFNNAFLLSIVAAEKRFVFFPISWREEGQISNAKLWSQSIKLLRYLTLFLFSKKRYLEKDFTEQKFFYYTYKKIN